MSKEELASFLKTTPEALEKFEESYQIHVMDDQKISDNLFQVNAKQAASLNPKLLQDDKEMLQTLIQHIVKELLSQTSIYFYDGEKATVQEFEHVSESEMVTLDEITQIPKHLRPELSGKYIKKSLSGETGCCLLSQYKQSLETNDPIRKKRLYDHFRQGLDMLDLDGLTYAILDRCQNSMGNWFPQLVDAVSENDFFKLPKTKIMKVPLPVLQLSRMEYMELSSTTFQIIDQFCYQAFQLENLEECFIKTGVFSSKYDFRNSHVVGADEIKEIGQYLLFITYQTVCMAHYDLSGRNQPVIYGAATTNEWVVREFIKDKEDNPCIYKGLPLHTEYRVFVDCDTREVLGINPYWDPEVMKQRFGKMSDAATPDMVHDYVIYAAHEEMLMRRYNENKNKIVKEIENLLPHLDLKGQWSIDIMQNGDDFWIIDMALAKDSALVSCVPKEKIKMVEEDWIPRIKG